MFEEIRKKDLADDVTFSFRYIGENCEKDKYTGYRVLQSANYSNNFIVKLLDLFDIVYDKEMCKEIVQVY